MKRRKSIVNIVLIIMIAAFSYGYGLSISANESALESRVHGLHIQNGSLAAQDSISDEFSLCDYQPQPVYDACSPDFSDYDSNR